MEMNKVPPGGPIAMFNLVRQLGVGSLLKVGRKRQDTAHYYDFENFLPPGSKAPEFTLLGLKGEETSLTDFRGKYVVLEFGAYT